MIVSMFGPPNAGKGTYGLRLAELLGVPYLSCGNLIRERLSMDEEWFQGHYSREIQDSGELCPTEFANAIVFEAMDSATGGCVLDGFPREPGQVEPFLQMLAGQGLRVVYIVQPIDVLLDRSANRTICRSCGKSYAIKNSYIQPNSDGTCVDCGGDVVRRKDDDPEVMRRRITVYEEITAPILEALRSHSKLYVKFSPLGDDVDYHSEILCTRIVWALAGSMVEKMGEIEITDGGKT